jgi:hypothetical protein
MKNDKVIQLGNTSNCTWYNMVYFNLIACSHYFATSGTDKILGLYESLKSVWPDSQPVLLLL